MLQKQRKRSSCLEVRPRALVAPSASSLSSLSSPCLLPLSITEAMNDMLPPYFRGFVACLDMPFFRTFSFVHSSPSIFSHVSGLIYTVVLESEVHCIRYTTARG